MAHDPDAGTPAEPCPTPPAEPAAWPGTQQSLPALLEWASRRRWFPLKGAPIEVSQVRVLIDEELAPGVHDLVLALPRQAASGPAEPVLLHVPLVASPVASLPSFMADGEAAGSAGFVLPGLAPASSGATEGAENAGDLALVDGPHHPAFWAAWAERALASGTVLDEAGTASIAERALHLRVITGEQSNTSVILPALPGQEGALIVKLLRVLAAGRNPDVEVPVALARHGWDRVPAPVAWSTLPLPTAAPATTSGEEGPQTLPAGVGHPDPAQPGIADTAVAAAFISGAEDGFTLACHAAGEDDGEGGLRRLESENWARSLGATTAAMHRHLAAALGSHEPVSPAALREALGARAEWALAEVPELAERIPGLADRIEAALACLTELPALPPATRIHGDYHLGQTLRSPAGAWFVLDFEGEPLRPLAQRCQPDQPLRDVAGMLRSFDYAAAVGHARHADWLPRMREVFLAGYEETLPAASPEEAHLRQVLTGVLELDKALYEAVYEARQRPDWLHIPLAGIQSVLDHLGTKSPLATD